MFKKLLYLMLAGIVLSIALACNSGDEPSPVYPIPSENQMRWQEMEYYAFIHYSLNTYTDQSWGFGNESLELFNPENLDCRQWARICKEAGMKGIIFTAKHHCGFCMWPSEYTEYSVKNTPWKDGKGDVVRELADACREYGLEFGVYLSPWDRNHAAYGTEEYVEYFRNQLKELLTGYGPIFETWFDGAQGGSGYYGGAYEDRHIDRKTYYQWKETFAMVRELQPGILIWNDGGDRGDLRWVGTEAGYVGETNWSQLNKEGDVDWNMLHYGLEEGDSWVSAEVNTSIRPEWFYHESEDTKVKTVPQLMETYYHSVGRNATLLLNVPVMPDGLIHPVDEERLKAFAEARKEAFADNLAYKVKTTSDNFRNESRKYSSRKAVDGKNDTYWALDDGVKSGSMTLDFGKEVSFNRFLVQEYIRLGQRVRSFTIEYLNDGEWLPIQEATTIGYKRILYFPTVRSRYLRFTVNDSRDCPLISNIEVYRAPNILEKPMILRTKNGKVWIIPSDSESEIYFTLDGTDPTVESERYTEPIDTEGRVEVKAIAYDRLSEKKSPVAYVSFDLPRTDWKVIGASGYDRIFDGSPISAWHQRGNGKSPVSLTIDLGRQLNIKGFKYLPDPNVWSPGIITRYSFDISSDGKTWKTVSEGEFSNIRNNPVEQVRTFPAMQGRYVRLNALANAENNTNIGYAEFNLITEDDELKTVGNPYLPLWEHIPDGEPYVFEDPDRPGEYRVYIYGSHDSNITEYCGRELVLWSAPVDNLNEWRYDGEIFKVERNAQGELLNANGVADVLYAPDVAVKIEADGSRMYYLYPNDQHGGRQNLIAKSPRPDGPFEVCNWSKDMPSCTEGVLGFDPAVFVDDDGRVYGYWGFERSYAAELDPVTMCTVKEGTEIIQDMIPGGMSDALFRFFEASSIRKIEDKYVLVYSRWTKDNEFGLPVSNYTLAYAYSDAPLGPWTYGGTIIDGRGREVDEKGNPIASATVTGNTHGGICKVGDQWYVFYHRQTGLNEFSRQAMVAPITVKIQKGKGGKVEISEGEYNSEGFSLDGLDPLEVHSAGLACWYTGPKEAVHEWPNKTFFGSYVAAGYGTDDKFEAPYAIRNNTNPVVNNTDGSIVGYKYFNLDGTYGRGDLTMILNLVPAGVDGTITVMVDRPWSSQGGKELGRVELKKDMPSVPVDVEIAVHGLSKMKGKHAIYLKFSSDIKDESLCVLNTIKFK